MTCRAWCTEALLARDLPVVASLLRGWAQPADRFIVAVDVGIVYDRPVANNVVSVFAREGTAEWVCVSCTYDVVDSMQCTSDGWSLVPASSMTVADVVLQEFGIDLTNPTIVTVKPPEDDDAWL